MSPYTSAWSHYFAAICFKIFGTSLLVYRASGIALVIAGVSLLCLALKNRGQALAGAIFPWIIAFFSAAVINHRFAIEINTFHVFCFGLFAWGLSAKESWRSDLAILFGAVFGITSHILFLAPTLSCLILAFWNGLFLSSRRRRFLSGIALILLAGFFFRIFFGIPERDKSLALLLIAAFSFLGVLFPFFAEKPIAYLRTRVIYPVRILFISASLLSAFFLLFFSEGSWAAAFFNGGQSDPRVMAWPLLALAIAITFSWKTLKSNKAFEWAVLTLILTAAMATKPAPRYFEIPFLILACGFALALASAPKKYSLLAFAIWTISGAAQLELNYFKPAREGNIPERSFHFLFFKDNSSDTLSKQDLARYLANSGCRFDQVVSSDIRIMDPLRFLSIGDWRVRATCHFGDQVIVERKSQMNEFPKNSIETNSFVLYTKDRR